MTEPNQPDPTQVQHVSPYPFAATLERVTQAITAAGMTIFAQIDQAAAAEAVGLTMPPTVLVLYGNPRGGTPVMLAAPQVALDLPLRLLLREDATGQVLVAYRPIGPLLRDAGVEASLATPLENAQRVPLKGLTS